MTRERVKLTDKEEKILVQAQLMGLSTASMVKIGNRLRALEREREQKAEVDEIVSRFSYKEKSNNLGWEITDSEGRVWHFTNRTKIRARGWMSPPELHYDVAVEKPGTRYHTRQAKSMRVHMFEDWGPARIMPEKNKELFAILRGIEHNRFDKVFDKK